jgi:hypothetical protein
MPSLLDAGLISTKACCNKGISQNSRFISGCLQCFIAVSAALAIGADLFLDSECSSLPTPSKLQNIKRSNSILN